jgi:cell division protein FtsI/penicillin-binding protein 2
MTEVLEKSINTGAVFAQSQLGETLFLKYIEKFGFFEPTGIDLRETYSENQELRKGRKINLATASFGQGITITPIQLAEAYGAIANGGKLVKPYLVERIFEDGKEIQTEPEISQPIISSKTVHQLTAMLVNVVENGFGKGAKVPGYYIAGKTGTAQVAEGGVYSPDKSIQTFAGFFPAFNPKFLILVKLDNPKTRTAEYSAVPIFHDLAEYIIYYYQIPPDYE